MTTSTATKFGFYSEFVEIIQTLNEQFTDFAKKNHNLNKPIAMITESLNIIKGNEALYKRAVGDFNVWMKQEKIIGYSGPSNLENFLEQKRKYIDNDNHVISTGERPLVNLSIMRTFKNILEMSSKIVKLKNKKDGEFKYQKDIRDVCDNKLSNNTNVHNLYISLKNSIKAFEQPDHHMYPYFPVLTIVNDDQDSEDDYVRYCNFLDYRQTIDMAMKPRYVTDSGLHHLIIHLAHSLIKMIQCHIDSVNEYFTNTLKYYEGEQSKKSYATFEFTVLYVGINRLEDMISMVIELHEIYKDNYTLFKEEFNNTVTIRKELKSKLNSETLTRKGEESKKIISKPTTKVAPKITARPPAEPLVNRPSYNSVTQVPKPTVTLTESVDERIRKQPTPVYVNNAGGLNYAKALTSSIIKNETEVTSDSDNEFTVVKESFPALVTKKVVKSIPIAQVTVDNVSHIKEDFSKFALNALVDDSKERLDSTSPLISEEDIVQFVGKRKKTNYAQEHLPKITFGEKSELVITPIAPAVVPHTIAPAVVQPVAQVENDLTPEMMKQFMAFQQFMRTQSQPLPTPQTQVVSYCLVPIQALQQNGGPTFVPHYNYNF